MTKWEYKLLRLDLGLIGYAAVGVEPAIDALEEALTQLGRDGWEATQVLPLEYEAQVSAAGETAYGGCSALLLRRALGTPA